MNTLECCHKDCDAEISLEVGYRDVMYDDSVAVLQIRCKKHGILLVLDSYYECSIKEINHLIISNHKNGR